MSFTLPGEPLKRVNKLRNSCLPYHFYTELHFYIYIYIFNKYMHFIFISYRHCADLFTAGPKKAQVSSTVSPGLQGVECTMAASSGQGSSGGKTVFANLYSESICRGLQAYKLPVNNVFLAISEPLHPFWFRVSPKRGAPKTEPRTHLHHSIRSHRIVA